MMCSVSLRHIQSEWSNIFYKLSIVQIQFIKQFKQFLVLALISSSSWKTFKIYHHIAEPCSNYFLELLKFTEHKYISKEKGK